MPIRRYACRECGRQLQLEQRKGEAAYKRCPYCPGETLYETDPPVETPSGGAQALIMGTEKKR